MTNVAVYGEIDMNLIDGSSIWLQSVSLMLATMPNVRVTVLLRTPLQRPLVTAPLAAHRGIRLVDPRELGGTAPRLSSEAAVRMLTRLDAEDRFDVVLLRGAGVVDAAVEARALERRIWFYYVPPHGSALDSDAAAMTRRGGWCSHILCQTEAIAERVRASIPGVGERVLLLPPMIPDRDGVPRPPLGPVRKLFYAGKFSPEYYFLEMVALFVRLRSEVPGLIWDVAGDKLHNPPDDPGFKPAGERALKRTAGLVWHGAVNRQEVRALAEGADLALSLRHPSMDVSAELSTKVLEYGAAGCPVLLNRNPLHASLLGDDYPLLASSVEEARAAVLLVSREPELRAEAQRRCHALSRRHTFSAVAAGLAAVLGGDDGKDSGTDGVGENAWSHTEQPQPAEIQLPEIRNPTGSPKLLLAGHEFRFYAELADHAVARGAALREDRWPKHVVHDEGASLVALEWAEAIHCEWCLGAAIFYSRRRLDSQRLSVRFHRMELETPYPGEVELDRVHTMVFVAQHVLEQACAQYGWPVEHPSFRVVPNMIDAGALARPKLPGAEFTLGLIGWVPMLKRVDRAIEILERLRVHDERFRLLVKGRGPWDYYWMATREAERRFYEATLARIERSQLLRGAVVFEPYGEDIGVFLQKIGWILSVSDIEGHGVAPAEGMASGSIPVVIDRPGAQHQYAAEWVHRDPDAAARVILEVVARGQTAAEAERAQGWARSWSREALLPVWDEILAVGQR